MICYITFSRFNSYTINCDLSKYIAFIIDHLNHDVSISSLLDPVERIQKALRKHRKKNGF